MDSCPRPPPTACSSNDAEPAPLYPPTRLPKIALLLGFAGALVLGGCGDDSSGTGGGGEADDTTATDATASGAGGANTAPSVNGGADIVLPSPVAEGSSIELTVEVVDAEGDAITLEATFEPFVEGTSDGNDLVLRMGYRSEADLPEPGTDETLGTLLARDARGAETTIAIKGEVTPIGWSGHTEWSDDGPEAREHGTVLVDDESGSIYVMFGSGYDPYLEPLGDAWRFDTASKTWSEVTMDGDVPPPGGSKRIAGVYGSGEGWIYGGYGEGNAVQDGLFHVVADGDALHFEELEQEGAAGGRLLHVFGYDPGTETFVAFGGASTALKGDTWTMKIDDGTATWTQVAGFPADGKPTPSPRFGAFYGMDEELGRLVLFSGQTSQTAFGQDTWILDMRAEGGPIWTEVTPPEGPVDRRNRTSVWDPSASRFFVFGGTSDGATTQPGLFVFDARPGHESWTQVDRADEPPLRSSGFGGFAAGAVWMGFGNSADGVFQDLTRLGS